MRAKSREDIFDSIELFKTSQVQWLQHSAY